MILRYEVIAVVRVAGPQIMPAGFAVSESVKLGVTERDLNDRIQLIDLNHTPVNPD